MSLARYQPGTVKKPRMAGSCRKLTLVKKYSLDELDDSCLSKIIGYTLALSSRKQDHQQRQQNSSKRIPVTRSTSNFTINGGASVANSSKSQESSPTASDSFGSVIMSFIGNDNTKMEMELSLVNKRWYKLTQIASQQYGICHVGLDKLRSKSRQPLKITSQNCINDPVDDDNDDEHHRHLLNRSQSDLPITTLRAKTPKLKTQMSTTKIPQLATKLPRPMVTNISSVKPPTRIVSRNGDYYHHSDFNKTSMSLTSAPNISIAPIKTQSNIPNQVVDNDLSLVKQESGPIGIVLFNKILGKIRKYRKIHIEGSMTRDEFRHFAFALGAERTDKIEFRLKLDNETSLAPVDFCSISRYELGLILDSTIDRLENVRAMLDEFHRMRNRTCQLILYMRDQKVTNFEDKIKKLAQLSRTADVSIHITAVNRISIDCCHLMWSVGRYIQQSQSSQAVNKRDSDKHESRCLFKICIQSGNSSRNWSELIIPFGRFEFNKIYADREDISRHKEIIRSLKRDCYNSFVKSVRDNMTSLA